MAAGKYLKDSSTWQKVVDVAGVLDNAIEGIGNAASAVAEFSGDPVGYLKERASARNHAENQRCFQRFYDPEGYHLAQARNMGPLAGGVTQAALLEIALDGGGRALRAVRSAARTTEVAVEGTEVAGEVAVGTSAPMLQEISGQVKNWLGKGYRTITNDFGDTVLVSRDGLRKMR